MATSLAEPDPADGRAPEQSRTDPSGPQSRRQRCRPDRSGRTEAPRHVRRPPTVADPHPDAGQPPTTQAGGRGLLRPHPPAPRSTVGEGLPRGLPPKGHGGHRPPDQGVQTRGGPPGRNHLQGKGHPGNPPRRAGPSRRPRPDPPPKKTGGDRRQGPLIGPRLGQTPGATGRPPHASVASPDHVTHRRPRGNRGRLVGRGGPGLGGRLLRVRPVPRGRHRRPDESSPPHSERRPGGAHLPNPTTRRPIQGGRPTPRRLHASQGPPEAGGTSPMQPPETRPPHNTPHHPQTHTPGDPNPHPTQTNTNINANPHAHANPHETPHPNNPTRDTPIPGEAPRSRNSPQDPRPHSATPDPHTPQPENPHENTGDQPIPDNLIIQTTPHPQTRYTSHLSSSPRDSRTQPTTINTPAHFPQPDNTHENAGCHPTPDSLPQPRNTFQFGSAQDSRTQPTTVNAPAYLLQPETTHEDPGSQPTTDTLTQTTPQHTQPRTTFDLRHTPNTQTQPTTTDTPAHLSQPETTHEDSGGQPTPDNLIIQTTPHTQTRNTSHLEGSSEGSGTRSVSDGAPQLTQFRPGADHRAQSAPGETRTRTTPGECRDLTPQKSPRAPDSPEGSPVLTNRTAATRLRALMAQLAQDPPPLRTRLVKHLTPTPEEHQLLCRRVRTAIHEEDQMKVA